MGSDDAVRYDLTDGVVTLTMNRPANRNALTPEMLNGLGDGLQAASADPEARVVVLTNEGPVFCAGADLSGKSGVIPGEGARHGVTDVLAAVQDCPRPVVGRIAGHCMGGGVGLAAACDLSIAATSVRFAFSEVRLGVAPAMISVVCLPKLRRGDALQLFLTGERIEATRAAELGLITSAVADEELGAAVGDAVAKIAAGGPNALRAAKRLVYDIPGIPRDEAFVRTTAQAAEIFSSAEAAEGMAAFREKRSASWVPPGAAGPLRS